jgi:hypothetical protein
MQAETVIRRSASCATVEARQSGNNSIERRIPRIITAKNVEDGYMHTDDMFCFLSLTSYSIMLLCGNATRPRTG